MSMRTIAWPSSLALLAGLLASSCGDDEQVVTYRGAGPPPESSAQAVSSTTTEAQPVVQPQEEDRLKFAQEESSTYRDPFRSYLEEFEKRIEGPEGEDTPRSPTEMFAVGEYKVIGIITGTPVPKAMVVDPTGYGHVIRPGDRIGKQGGRVAAIYNNEVVVQGSLPGEDETVLYLNPPSQTKESYQLNVVESPIETAAQKKLSAAKALQELSLQQLLQGQGAAGPGAEAEASAAQGAAALGSDLPTIPVVPLLPRFMMQPGTTPSTTASSPAGGSVAGKAQ
ncbi:MAG: pilus assembly protein PilP [Deltaproteobacteria bacterium]|nr:pilus assembly protein PilP [Deltaproteobacteria bacterium]